EHAKQQTLARRGRPGAGAAAGRLRRLLRGHQPRAHGRRRPEQRGRLSRAGHGDVVRPVAGAGRGAAGDLARLGRPVARGQLRLRRHPARHHPPRRRERPLGEHAPGALGGRAGDRAHAHGARRGGGRGRVRKEPAGRPRAPAGGLRQPDAGREHVLRRDRRRAAAGAHHPLRPGAAAVHPGHRDRHGRQSHGGGERGVRRPCLDAGVEGRLDGRGGGCGPGALRLRVLGAVPAAEPGQRPGVRDDHPLRVHRVRDAVRGAPERPAGALAHRDEERQGRDRAERLHADVPAAEVPGPGLRHPAGEGDGDAGAARRSRIAERRRPGRLRAAEPGPRAIQDAAPGGDHRPGRRLGDAALRAPRHHLAGGARALGPAQVERGKRSRQGPLPGQPGQVHSHQRERAEVEPEPPGL
ncbi:MAG: hypothetical protein AVDCRST_MAG68-461, partial [uncultured Gemmatimonadetes bacterium]